MMYSDAELKDKLLAEVYHRHEKKIYGTGSLEMAELFHVPENEIINAVNEIKKYNYHFIGKNAGFGDNQITINSSNDAYPDVYAFQAKGGFIKIDQIHQQESQRKEQQKTREERLSELQIQELLRLPEEAKRTRQLSRIAILTAIATLLFEICKNLWSK